MRLPIQVGTDKDGTEQRLSRLNRVEGQSPSSALCQQPPVQPACAGYLTAGSAYRKSANGVHLAEVALATARGVHATNQVALDADYNLLLVTVSGITKESVIIAGIGLEPRPAAQVYVLAAPLAVAASFDYKTGLLIIDVKKAPGMRTTVIEICSGDPNAPTAKWEDIKKNGAEQKLSGYGPGTYWIRAAHRQAKAQSGYTAPVMVVIK